MARVRGLFGRVIRVRLAAAARTRAVRPLLVIAALAAILALPSGATAASQGYDVSVAGSQTVSWSVNGTEGSCEIRRGRGSGKVTFRYSSRRSLAFANAYGRTYNFGFSMAAHAKGHQTGSFSETLGTPCPGFEPAPALTAARTACGATDFWLRVAGEAHGAFVYLTGTEAIERPSKPSRNSYALCPFANVTGGDMANALGATGPSTGGCENTGSPPLWKQTRELATRGHGLVAFRLAASRGSLLRPRRRTTTLTRRVSRKCTLPVVYGGGVKVKVTSQVTVTLRRR